MQTVDALTLLRTAGALLLVLAIVAGLAVAARRLLRVPGGGGRVLRVLAATGVGPRERVVLVEVGGKQVLLGVAPGRVQTLHVLEEPVVTESPADAAPGGERFARHLQRLMAGRNRP